MLRHPGDDIWISFHDDRKIYSVWQNSTTDTFKLAEMQKVIDYYSKLGYTINRISDDLVHLSWKISW